MTKLEKLQEIQKENFTQRKYVDENSTEQEIGEVYMYMKEENDDEEAEHSIEVYCPKCGAKRITTPNTGITCKGCGARIVIGEDGEIHRVIPSQKVN